MTVVGVTTNHESLPCPFESSEWIPWGRPLYDGLVALSAVARSRTERWHGPSGPVLRPPSPSSPLSSPPLSTSSFEGQPSYQASETVMFRKKTATQVSVIRPGGVSRGQVRSSSDGEHL